MPSSPVGRVLAALLVLSGSAQGHEPTGWWVWVKQPSSTEWVPFAPAHDYGDCVDRMLPLAAKLVARGFGPGWAPKFKCEERS
jgi:hypothetical protein